MSDNNNGIILAGAIVAYLYLKRTQARPVGVPIARAPLPGSMPASVGSGTKQIAVGALAGLLQSLAAAPANNTSQSYFTRPVLPDYSGVEQEAVVPDYTAPGASDLIDMNDYGYFA